MNQPKTWKVLIKSLYSALRWKRKQNLLGRFFYKHFKIVGAKQPFALSDKGMFFLSLLSFEDKRNLSALFLVFWATEEQFCAMLHLEEWNLFKSASSSWEITVISPATDLGVWKGDWVHTECKMIFYPEINEYQCIYLCIFFLLWDCAVQSLENIFLLLLDIWQRGCLHRFFIALFLFPLKGYMLNLQGQTRVLLDTQHAR